ncbi:MAG: PepSY domain-containing protein, partial [Helicobacter sp.]|nr:PepSY domain-containing protein [Helicobacter sp.]
MVKQFRNIHIYLSLFFLPVALMYALTGALYIFGFNQDSGASKSVYTLNVSIPQGQEIQTMLEYLKTNNIPLPKESKPKLDKKGYLTIGSAHYFAGIKKLGEETYSITTTKHSFVGDIMILHKGKGQWYFNILAIGFSITIALLYLSGLIITLFNSKKNRFIQYMVMIAGIVVSAV